MIVSPSYTSPSYRPSTLMFSFCSQKWFTERGFIVFGKPVFCGNQIDSSLSESGMSSLVIYWLVWALPSGIMPLGGKVWRLLSQGCYPLRDATPSGMLRLTGRLVGVRVKDSFVNYAFLTSHRTSIEHQVCLSVLILAVPWLIKQNQSPGISDIESRFTKFLIINTSNKVWA